MKTIHFLLLVLFPQIAFSNEIFLSKADNNEIRGLISQEDGSTVVSLSVRDEKKKDPLVLEKLDSKGKTVWETTLLDVEPAAESLIQLENKKFMVAGNDPDNHFFKIAVYDSEGELVNSFTKKTDGIQQVEKLIQNKKGEIFAVVSCWRSVSPWQLTVEKNIIYKVAANGVVPEKEEDSFKVRSFKISFGEEDAVWVAGTSEGIPFLSKYSELGAKRKEIWSSKEEKKIAGNVLGLVVSEKGPTVLTQIEERYFLSRFTGDGKLKGQRFLEKSFPQLEQPVLSKSTKGGYLVSGLYRNDFYSLKLKENGISEGVFTKVIPKGYQAFKDHYGITITSDGKYLVGGGLIPRNEGNAPLIEPAYLFFMNEGDFSK